VGLGEYINIGYTEGLVDAIIELTAGSVGNSYDTAFAETSNCFSKSELIPWRWSAS
jgi:hypothetical protein